MSRFDYVKYDGVATAYQSEFKNKCESMESDIEKMLQSPRAKALALTKLEEVYMWIGKAIRDDQIARGASGEDLPERSNV